MLVLNTLECAPYVSPENGFRSSLTYFYLGPFAFCPQILGKVWFCLFCNLIFGVFSCFCAAIYAIFFLLEKFLSLYLSVRILLTYSSSTLNLMFSVKNLSPFLYMKLWKHNLWILLCYNMPYPYDIVIYVLELFLLTDFNLPLGKIPIRPRDGFSL